MWHYSSSFDFDTFLNLKRQLLLRHIITLQSLQKRNIYFRTKGEASLTIEVWKILVLFHRCTLLMIIEIIIHSPWWLPSHYKCLCSHGTQFIGRKDVLTMKASRRIEPIITEVQHKHPNNYRIISSIA